MRHVPSKTKAQAAHRGLRVRPAPPIQLLAPERVPQDPPDQPWEHQDLQDQPGRQAVTKVPVERFVPVVVAIVLAVVTDPTVVLWIKPVSMSVFVRPRCASSKKMVIIS